MSTIILYKKLENLTLEESIRNLYFLLIKGGVTPKEYYRILSQKNTNRVLQSISARYMIFEYLKQNNSTLKFNLSVNHCGRPIIIGLNKFISISYSDNLVVVAISDSSVGIDVENSKRKFPKIIIENWQQEERLSDPFRIWTAKESYLKFLGVGLKKDLKDILIKCSSNTNIIIDNNKKQVVNSRTISRLDYVITLTSQEKSFGIYYFGDR
ncbi:4'-phosphopantetheinyl transferase family protein [Streptococcus dentasini]